MSSVPLDPFVPGGCIHTCQSLALGFKGGRMPASAKCSQCKVLQRLLWNESQYVNVQHDIIILASWRLSASTACHMRSQVFWHSVQALKRSWRNETGATFSELFKLAWRNGVMESGLDGLHQTASACDARLLSRIFNRERPPLFLPLGLKLQNVHTSPRLTPLSGCFLFNPHPPVPWSTPVCLNPAQVLKWRNTKKGKSLVRTPL